MFWGLALVSVFIPLAHFILVPSFVLAGIVTALVRSREDRRLILLRAPAPAAAPRRSSGRAAASRAAAASTARSATAT